ncbi:MAG: class II aldolase/adducin family protein [Clostridium sp.]|nr:class II aldolase/adducin family protein [Clostridium sp.]
MSTEVEKGLKKLVEYTRLAWNRGLTESTGGNMSMRVGNEIYITPTGFVKHFITAEDFVVLNLKGEQIRGKRKLSSEYRMHVKIYNERDDIKSVFHAHPRYTLIYAINHAEIPIDTTPENLFMLSNIEYVPYYMAGTDDFADAFVPGLRKGKDIFLLYNHGVTTCADSIEGAFAKLESLETCCFVSIMGSIVGEICHAKPVKISDEDIKQFLDKLAK